MTNNTRPAGLGDLINNEIKYKLQRMLARIRLGRRILRDVRLGRVSGMQQLLNPRPRTPPLTSPDAIGHLLTPRPRTPPLTRQGATGQLLPPRPRSPLLSSPDAIGQLGHLRHLGIVNKLGESPLETPTWTPGTPPHTPSDASQHSLIVINELGELPLETPGCTPRTPPHTSSDASSERSYPPSPTSSVPTVITDFSDDIEDDKALRPGRTSTSAALLEAYSCVPIATSEPSPIPHTLVPGHHSPRPARPRTSDSPSQSIPSFPLATPRLGPIAYQPDFDLYNEFSYPSPAARQQYLLPSGHQRFNKDTSPITPNFSNSIMVAGPDIDDLGLPESASRPRPPPGRLSSSVVGSSSSPPKLNPIPYSGPFDPYADEISAPPPVPERNPARLRRPYSVDTPVTPEFNRPPPRQIGGTDSVGVPTVARYNTNGRELCYTPDLRGEGFHVPPRPQWEYEGPRQEHASVASASASRQSLPVQETDPSHFPSGLEVVITTPTSPDEEETSWSRRSRVERNQQATEVRAAKQQGRPNYIGLPPELQRQPLGMNPGPGSSSYARGDYDYRDYRASETQNHHTPPPRHLDSAQQHREQRDESGQGPNQHRWYGLRPSPDHPNALRRSVTDPQPLPDALDEKFARNPPRDTVPNPNLSPFDFDPRSSENSSKRESTPSQNGLPSRASSLKLGKKTLIKFGKDVMTILNGEGRKKF